MDAYETLQVAVADKVAHVMLNRPDKSNAMNAAFWEDCRRVFQWIDGEAAIRAVVLSGNGRHFSSGIDLELLGSLLDGSQNTGQDSGKDTEPARRVEALRRMILQMQQAFTAIEQCRVPVLAAVQGACIGGAVDMVSACDMRYATASAFFVIKEVDVGLTADMGTLQRLPHIIGDGMMRELAYTGHKVLGKRALEIGLVNRVYKDKEAMLDEVLGLAREIAGKSPLAVRGTKQMILYTRDHTVADGLNYVATWNAGMLSPTELREAIAAQMEQRAAVFED